MKSIYLKLTNPDIPGESTDRDHEGWIEIDAMSHQMYQPTSPVASSAGGHSVGRTEHGDISLTKTLDLSSPMLYQALSGATTFESAQLVFYRDAGDGRRVKYLEIQLKEVLISQIFTGTGEGLLPVESICLRYAAIQWTYRKQNMDGSQAGVTQGAWSLTRNDKTFSI